MTSFNPRRLRAERVARGLSQDDMAEKMGWKSRAPYAKRENGIVSTSADELAEFAKILEIPMTNLNIFFTVNVPEREREESK